MNATCPTCRAVTIPGDRYCAGCGRNVQIPAPGRFATADDSIHPLTFSEPVEPATGARRWSVMVRLALIGLILAGGVAAVLYVVNDSRDQKEQVIAAPEQVEQAGAASSLAPQAALSSGGSSAGGEVKLVPGILTTGGRAAYSGTAPAITGDLALGGGAAPGVFAMMTHAGLHTAGDTGGGAMPGVAALTDRTATGEEPQPVDGTEGAAYFPGA